jgi:hypothetical protein
MIAGGAIVGQGGFSANSFPYGKFRPNPLKATDAKDSVSVVAKGEK